MQPVGGTDTNDAAILFVLHSSWLKSYLCIFYAQTANLTRKSGPLPRPTILERVDQDEYDPAAEVEVRAARRAIIKARAPQHPLKNMYLPVHSCLNDVG